jgi:N-acetylglucosamine-6-phosphate deacetylase
MANDLLIKNALLYTEKDSNRLNDIRISSGKIEKIAPSLNDGDVEIFNADGNIVTPGFIDIHIHGAGGEEATSVHAEHIHTMSQSLAQIGTTGFLATPVYIPATAPENLRLLDSFEPNSGESQMLGIHLEGPFVNRKKNGGMQQDWILEPSESVLDEIMSSTNGSMKMMTIAPEIDENLKLTSRLQNAGIIPAFGHTTATFEESLEFIRSGVKHITHLYNAMPGIHHREPGPLLAIFEHDDVTVQLISDGNHVSPEIINWTAAQIGTDRIITITDGMQGTGLPDGQYIYNGKEYESRGGTAYYLDGTIIGSTLGLAQHVMNFCKFTGCEFAEAVHTGTLNPARLLGLDHRKGTIDPGKDADLVILDADLQVKNTIIAGEIISAHA